MNVSIPKTVAFIELDLTLERTIKLTIVCLLLAGCGYYKPVQPPNVKINQVPDENYELELEIISNPGISGVESLVSYEIRNGTDCVPTDHTKAIGGIIPKFPQRFRPEIKHNGNEKYYMNISIDKLVDEDYYSMGVCNWNLVGASFLIKNLGASLSAKLSVSEIRQGKIKYLHCTRKSIPTPAAVCLPFTMSGLDTFAVSVAAKRIVK